METDTDDDCTRDTDQTPSPSPVSPFWMFPSSLGNSNKQSHMTPSSLNLSNSSLDNSTRIRKHKDNKICGVCGDKALGYNFDAISCESCKAFFRRNAFKGIDYFKCPYDERCRMDQSNRRFCKRCRLKKCFEIGMRKEYILTEEEKQLKRRKIEENRSRKLTSNTLNNNNNSNNNTSNNNTTNGSSSGSSSSNKNNTNNHNSPDEAGTSYQRSFHHQLEHDLQCQLRFSNHTTNNNNEPPDNQQQVTSQTCALSSEDAQAIEELLVAYKRSLDIQMDRDVPRSQASFADLVNIAELSIRRVIAMAKQVRVFKSLPQADQIHLLKGGSIELLILRSVMTFDKERQHFLDPVDQEETKAMSVEQLQHAENGTGLFDEHMRYVKSLAIDLRADETTLLLLLVISLFSPDRGSLLRCSEILRYQECYSTLLQRYLGSRYPPNTASQLFPKLLIKLTDIRNLNEEHSHVLLKVNPEGIQPLMKEVLELSHS